MDASRKERTRPRGAVFVLTGERGSGKTMIVAQVIADARARGLEVAGIITGVSGPEPDAPREVVDVRSGDSRLLGTQLASTERTRRFAAMPSRRAFARARTAARAAGISLPGSSGSDSLTPGWRFDEKVFAWANEVLSAATPCDLLVVDEIGPLELVGDRGWIKALEILRSGDFRAALVVCRPSLLDELEARLGVAPAGLFRADIEATADLPTTIVDRMLR